MKRLPILNLARSPVANSADIAGMDTYQPLVTIWVLRMALACGWYREGSGRRKSSRGLRRFSLRDGHVFLEEQFQALTGVRPPEADEGEDEQFVTTSQLKRLLEAR